MNTNLATSSKILEELECPVCLEHMVSEIIQCSEGHSLCLACKNKLEPMCCPICRSEINNKRNFILEKLAVFFNYPCKFEGCSAILSANDMKKHTLNCEHRIYDCILDFKDCEWRGKYSCLKDHLETNHNNYVEDWYNDQYKILFYGEEIFLACKTLVAATTDNESGHHKYSAMSARSFKNYNLCLDFADENIQRLECYFKGPCHPKCTIENLWNNYCVIKIPTFITESYQMIKCRIEEKTCST